MSVTATDADLEQKIAEQRKKAEQAMEDAKAAFSPYAKRMFEALARSHYAHMAGLISMRTDERVEDEHA